MKGKAGRLASKHALSFYTAVLVCRGEFREAGGKNAETVSVAEMYTYKNIGV